MEPSDNPQVFLSYAHDDLQTVRKLYAALKARKVNVWFDKESIGPGKWLPQITRAIARSRFFLICLSSSALRRINDPKPGFVDKELQQAYDIAMAQDEAVFTIVPLRLETALSHGDNRLSIFQQYDLFDDWDFAVNRLALYLGGESADIKIETEEESEDEKRFLSVRDKGAIAYVNQEYDKALPLLETALTINPHDADTWYLKGVTLGHQSRYEEALVTLEKALSLNAHHLLAIVNKGAILNILRRYEESLAAHEQAAKVDPNNFIVWFGQGLVLQQLGRHLAAMRTP